MKTTKAKDAPGTFLHGDGSWRFATSPSGGTQPFKLLEGQCLLAEVRPCPTFGSGWSDEEILQLIQSAPGLLRQRNELKAFVQTIDVWLLSPALDKNILEEIRSRARAVLARAESEVA